MWQGPSQDGLFFDGGREVVAKSGEPVSLTSPAGLVSIAIFATFLSQLREFLFRIDEFCSYPLYS
jgi:hypothetical protein